jgi:hypothetical protein
LTVQKYDQIVKLRDAEGKPLWRAKSLAH